MLRLVIELRMILTVVLVAFQFLGLLPAQAAIMPVSWPWYGVSMDSLSSNPEDLHRYHAQLGIDTVRLQLKPTKLAKRTNISPDAAWDKSMLWLDAMLDTSKRLHIRAIINLSYFPIDPAYVPNSKIKIAQYTPEFWSDPSQLNGVVATVTRLMKHLRARGEEFAAIDIMSEPGVRDGPRLVAPDKWEGLMKRVIKAIRAERLDLWILLSPPPQGLVTSYSGFKPFEDGRIIYNAHIYLPHQFASQGIGKKPIGVEYPGYVNGKKWDTKELWNAMQPLRDFQRKYDLPVIVGEFSAVRWAGGSEQYIRDLAAIFDEFGWSWFYFSGSGWHGWNPDYNQNYPGMDKLSAGAWKQDYVGAKTERWNTLRTIFKVQGNK